MNKDTDWMNKIRDDVFTEEFQSGNRLEIAGVIRSSSTENILNHYAKKSWSIKEIKQTLSDVSSHFQKTEAEYNSEKSKLIDSRDVGKSRIFSTRILICGDVQGGKTALQNALAGEQYDIIVGTVYAGSPIALRRQNHERLADLEKASGFDLINKNNGDDREFMDDNARAIVKNIMQNNQASIISTTAIHIGNWVEIIEKVVDQIALDERRKVRVLIINDEADAGSHDSQNAASNNERNLYNQNLVNLEKVLCENFGSSYIQDYTATPQACLASDFQRNENKFYSGIFFLENRENYFGVKKGLEGNCFKTYNKTAVLNDQVLSDSFIQQLISNFALKSVYLEMIDVKMFTGKDQSVKCLIDNSLRRKKTKIGKNGLITEGIFSRVSAYKTGLTEITKSSLSIRDAFNSSFNKYQQLFTNLDKKKAFSLYKNIIREIEVKTIIRDKDKVETDGASDNSKTIYPIFVGGQILNRGLTVSGAVDQVLINNKTGKSDLIEDSGAQTLRGLGDKPLIVHELMEIHTCDRTLDMIRDYSEWFKYVKKEAPLYNILNEHEKMLFKWKFNKNSTRKKGGLITGTTIVFEDGKSYLSEVNGDYENEHVQKAYNSLEQKISDNHGKDGVGNVLGCNLDCSDAIANIKQLDLAMAGGLLKTFNIDDILSGYKTISVGLGYTERPLEKYKETSLKHNEGLLMGKFMHNRNTKRVVTTKQVVDTNYPSFVDEFGGEAAAKIKEINSKGLKVVGKDILNPILHLFKYLDLKNNGKIMVGAVLLTPGSESMGLEKIISNGSTEPLAAIHYG